MKQYHLQGFNITGLLHIWHQAITLQKLPAGQMDTKEQIAMEFKWSEETNSKENPSENVYQNVSSFV